MYNGLIDWPWWGYLVYTLIVTHITIAGVTIYLHRHSAHRALDLHPVVSHFFRFWLWLTTGMVTKQWTAIHRKHHAKCETPEDPHSPQIVGLKKVLWQGAELYRAEAKNDETMKRYGAGTPDDWMEHHVYSHSVVGVSILMIMNIILFGPIGLTIWAVQMVWIPFWAAGVVNGVGHYYGYRNFTCPDASTNLVPWGILIGGEELHNNHHAFGTSAKLSNKWYEFDIGWLYIRTLETLGLAKVKKVAPRPKLGAATAEVNAQTLDALITHRFDLMTRYAKAIRHEFARTLEKHKHDHSQVDKKTLRQASRWVAGDLEQMPVELREPVDSVLAESPALTKLCIMRAQLVTIWEKTNASREQLVHHLQEWCKQAEASGIRALEELAVRVRRYVI